MTEFIRNALKKQTIKQFIKYLFVGGSSFLLDYGLFLLFYKKIGVSEVYSNMLSVFISFWYNFLLNRFWTFGSKTTFLEQMIYYVALMLFNMLFSSWFIYIMYSRFSISPVIGKVIAMCLIVAWNFILYKTVIFKSKNVNNRK